MKLRDFLQWGEQALALRHNELAEEIARYLLRQSPSNLSARALLGNVYLKSPGSKTPKTIFCRRWIWTRKM